LLTTADLVLKVGIRSSLFGMIGASQITQEAAEAFAGYTVDQLKRLNRSRAVMY